MGTQPPSPKGGRAPPQFSAHVYCGKTTAWIKIPLGTEVGLGSDDIVVDGVPGKPFQKRVWSPLPNFWHMSIVAKWLQWIKMVQPTLCQMGTQLPSPKRRRSPKFLADFYCRQTAAFIKMPLSMEVSLSPGDFVLDGDPAPSPKGHSPSIFGHICCG